jgi:hypothetical protein
VAKRGRRKGSIIRLRDDPGRFEVAVWFALTAILEMKPYPAAKLVTFLVASDRPITTESIDGILFKSSTTHRTTVAGHADRVRRKTPEIIARADDDEWAWLTSSAKMIVALLKYAAEGNIGGFSLTVDILRSDGYGWAGTLDRICKRISASLKSNFPAAESPLNRAATRLLRETQDPA